VTREPFYVIPARRWWESIVERVEWIPD